MGVLIAFRSLRSLAAIRLCGCAAAVTIAVALPAAAQDKPPVGPLPEPISPPPQAPPIPAAPRPPAAPLAPRPPGAMIPWYAPREIPYVEGMPVPYGYQLDERRHRTLITVGASVFAAGWLAAALTAASVTLGPDRHRSEVAPLFIPFAGPWITLVTSRSVQLNDQYERTNGVLLIADGVTQIAGAAILVAGLLTKERFLRRGPLPEWSAASPLAPGVLVGPRGGELTWRF